MKTNHNNSICFVLSLCILSTFLGCVGRDRVDIKADLLLFQTGQLTMGFDEIDDNGVSIKQLDQDSTIIVLKAFEKAIPLNQEIMETPEPRLMVYARKDRIGFVTLSKEDGQFLVSFQAYKLDPSGTEWNEFKSIFEEEKRVNSP